MIYINNTLRITKLDDKNLQLEQYRKCIDPKTKKETHKWKWCGYYGDIKSALMDALKKRLFDCAENEMTLKEVIVEINTARDMIIKALKEKEN